MDKDFLSPVDLLNESTTNEDGTLSHLISGPTVVGSRFIDVVKAYGLKNTLKSLYGRYLYTLRLWRLRNRAIMIALCENYEKIPNGTPSKFLTSVFVHNVQMRRMLYKSESGLRRKLIMNPYQVKMTDNNS